MNVNIHIDHAEVPSQVLPFLTILLANYPASTELP
jgi:hypothetical protein